MWLMHVPLYLEWAPEGIFLELAAPSDAPAQANITAVVAAVAATASREAGRGAGEGGAREGKEGGGVKSIKKQGAVGLSPVVVDGKAARRMVAKAELVGGVEGLQDTVAKNLSFNPPLFLFHCLPVSSLPPSALAVSPHSPPLATTIVFVKNLSLPVVLFPACHPPLSLLYPPCQPTIHSVFVKNLSFATTEAQLKEHLEKLLRSKQAGADGKGPAIRSITIRKRVRNGTQLSMGFGFVEFGSVLAAHRAAVHKRRHVVVYLSSSLTSISFPCLPLSPSPSPRHDHPSLHSPLPCLPLQPFEATKRDIQQLFAPFGQLKSMRLPRKFDGGHRGFVFVEFATKREAESAFDALKSTHLYGRHLVLERAKEGEELDELRAKTAGQFLDRGAGGVRYKKRAKLGQGVDDSDVPFQEMQFG
ncbi:unnamed protein product [Closterium sp. NIES-64]|nr:unnamed protein product [Closterium sp. NIES-64]